MCNIELIKARRLHGQHLTDKKDMKTVTENLNGFQAQFWNNAVNSLRFRSNDALAEDILGNDFVKNWTVRGTSHLLLSDDLPIFIRKNYRCDDWSVPTWWNQRPSWKLTPERQGYLSSVVLEALSEGSKSREELRSVCKEKGMTHKEEVCMFDPWGGGIRELCERGFINGKACSEKEYVICPLYEPLPDDEAELIQMKRYFENFAPASLRDAAYYFGYTLSKTKALMMRLPLSVVVCNGTEYFYMGDIADGVSDIPECLFLSGFDQLMLGYKKEENLFMPTEYLRSVFNLYGIVKPVFLLYGNVAGSWKLDNGRMVMNTFGKVPFSDRRKLENLAGTYFNFKRVEWNCL